MLCTSTGVESDSVIHKWILRVYMGIARSPTGKPVNERDEILKRMLKMKPNPLSKQSRDSKSDLSENGG